MRRLLDDDLPELFELEPELDFETRLPELLLRFDDELDRLTRPALLDLLELRDFETVDFFLFDELLLRRFTDGLLRELPDFLIVLLLPLLVLLVETVLLEPELLLVVALPNSLDELRSLRILLEDGLLAFSPELPFRTPVAEIPPREVFEAPTAVAPVTLLS
ncbi:MAG: hypothetical protein ACE5I1_21970 [bacterium]